MDDEDSQVLKPFHVYFLVFMFGMLVGMVIETHFLMQYIQSLQPQ